MTMESLRKKIKVRDPNFSKIEKDVLIELVMKFNKIIESKKSDAVSIKQKEKAWEMLKNEFNTICIATRSVQTLKNCWDNLKKRFRNAHGEQKIDMHKTGNRKAKQVMSDLDLKIKNILNVSLDGSKSSYDSDANYNEGFSDSFPIVVKVETNEKNCFTPCNDQTNLHQITAKKTKHILQSLENTDPSQDDTNFITLNRKRSSPETEASVSQGPSTSQRTETLQEKERNYSNLTQSSRKRQKIVCSTQEKFWDKKYEMILLSLELAKAEEKRKIEEDSRKKELHLLEKEEKELKIKYLKLKLEKLQKNSEL